MFEKILKLYVASQLGEVHSPMPHLFGPPGTGKSSVVADVAKLLGVDLHVINVSRISPLELEGVQMPVENNTKLHLLTATFWTQLKDGDILLLDEFLRGFPEVYNGLLDILTSRQVGGFKLPNVFILGASNSTVAYDPALEDRLLHLPVPDIRKSKTARMELGTRIGEALGLLPEMFHSMEMLDMINVEITPMYEVLDQRGAKVGSTSTSGRSARNLIGQAKLRHVESAGLRELLETNNQKAMSQSKPQFVVYPGRPSNRRSLAGPAWERKYIASATPLQDNPVLTPLQRQNISLNLQLFSMESARSEEKETVEDDTFITAPF